MSGELQLFIQNLNENHFHASAWILWKPTEANQFQAVFQSGFGTGDLQQLTADWQGHDELLQQVFSTGEIRRASAANETGQDSRSSTLNLLVSAVSVDGKIVSLLELFFQDANQLEAVLQNDLLEKNLSRISQQLAAGTSSQERENDLAVYLTDLVAQTSPERLAHTVSNAIVARYGAQRCSIFSVVNQSYQLQGVSGQFEYEPRAELIHQLHQVVRTHAESLSAQRAVLSLSGESLGTLKSDFAYLIRLERVFQVPGSAKKSAALILVEYTGEHRDDARENDFLQSLPLWKLAIQACRVKIKRTVPFSKRTAFIPLGVLAVLLLLLFVKVDLTIRASGQLVPVTRYHLFAPESGLIKIEDLHLPSSGKVSSGQHLLTITNPELALQLSQLEGKIATLMEEIRSLKNRRPEQNDDARGNSIDRDLSIRLAEANTQLTGLVQEKELLQQRIRSLEIRSPHRGSLLSWDAEHQLAGRPVTRGQLLVTIGESEGEWEVLADISEDDIGPLKKAREKKEIPFTVKLDSGSNKKWSGTLSSVSPIILQQTSDEFVLPVTGKISQNVTDVLPGSRITMRISCGKYPLGYVLFRGLIDTIYKSISW